MTGFDLERRVVHARDDPGRDARVPLRQPDRGGRRRPVLLRPRRVRAHRAGHEDDRRRVRAAPSDLRRVRARRVDADETERRDWLTVVVVGAGPTGVELAGQIRELAVRSLGRLPQHRPDPVRVVLLDGGEEPLATFGDSCRARAARELDKMGVELRMRARVVGVDAIGRRRARDPTARNGSRRTPSSGRPGCRPLRWPKMLADATGAEIDRSGRIAVLPDLTLPVTPRCSPWATWRRSTASPACVRSPCRAASTPRTRSAGG